MRIDLEEPLIVSVNQEEHDALAKTGLKPDAEDEGGVTLWFVEQIVVLRTRRDRFN